ncbi:MAG: hypothetical protein IV094_11785 [Vitreoscilla sp.]|nr:hypothetical protein [Vitreoscilla sp.]
MTIVKVPNRLAAQAIGTMGVQQANSTPRWPLAGTRFACLVGAEGEPLSQAEQMATRLGATVTRLRRADFLNDTGGRHVRAISLLCSLYDGMLFSGHESETTRSLQRLSGLHVQDAKSLQAWDTAEQQA